MKGSESYIEWEEVCPNLLKSMWCFNSYVHCYLVCFLLWWNLLSLNQNTDICYVIWGLFGVLAAKEEQYWILVIDWVLGFFLITIWCPIRFWEMLWIHFDIKMVIFVTSVETYLVCLLQKRNNTGFWSLIESSVVLE